MGNNHLEVFEDPELAVIETSEISAAIDISVFGEDKIFRPVYINQDDQIISLTPEDALRLYKFLRKAVVFLDEYQKRIAQ